MSGREKVTARYVAATAAAGHPPPGVGLAGPRPNVPRVLAIVLTMLGMAWLHVDDATAVDPAHQLLPPPVASWSFDEAVGEVCRDRGPWKLDGKYLAGAAPRWGQVGLAAGWHAPRRQQRITIPLDDDAQRQLAKLFSGTFSLEVWLYDEAPPPDGKTNYAILYKADSTQFIRNSLWFYRARQDGAYSFTMTDARQAQTRVTFRPLSTDGSGDRIWHHYVIVVDRSIANHVIRGYRDGRLVDEHPIPATLQAWQNQGDLQFGNDHHHNSPWHGAMDELSVFRQALTADQIAQRYTAMSADRTVPPRSRTAQEKLQFFENSIRPLLVAKCVDCHDGEPTAESDLPILSRAALLAGADFGPAIFPGRALDSTLIQAVKWTHKELRMPPDAADRLSKAEIRLLEEWINDGAVWPEPDNGARAEMARHRDATSEKSLETDHWAYQPRVVAKPPTVANGRWMHHAIDQFVESARERHQLPTTPRANRLTLIRRVTYDLTGLPPTPREVDAFLNDRRTDEHAFATLVDRLLASPHYGERWGRHWMDIARYADTQGDVGDYPIPDAWRYRNWIIDAFNADLPFDAFLRAQIAGDVLAMRGLQDGSIDDDTARQLVIATGFLALSQRYGNSKREHLHLTLENSIDTLGRGVLGLTLRCSRCHDHPFDAILQSDYYGLYGILDSTTMPWMGMSVEKSPSGLVPSVPRVALQKQAAEHWKIIARYEYQINNHFRPWLKPTLDDFKRVDQQWQAAAANSALRAELGEQRSALLDRHDGKFRELMLHGLEWLRREKTNQARRPPLEMVFAVSEGRAHDVAIQRRGEPNRKGPVVPRRFLQVIDGPQAPPIPNGSGRLELAHWLTQSEHPLVPRVIVNRVWQWHFGRGLVATSDNFGVRGDAPSHPELLDWLTQQFVEDGWSIKRLHRRILTTETYCLASHPSEEEADPNNVYLTRFPSRRLEGEAIRDAMLAVSGQLDRRPAAAHPLPSWDQKRYGLNGPFHTEFETNRRSVYLLTQRLFAHSFLGLFNPPDRNASTARRASTDVPAQSLYLMNSPFIQRQAEAFARRLLQERATTAERTTWAFQLAYGRTPEPAECEQFTEYIQRYREAAPTIEPLGERQLWTSIARAILTSNEFFFVD